MALVTATFVREAAVVRRRRSRHAPLLSTTAILVAFALSTAPAESHADSSALGVPALQITAPNGATSLLIGTLHAAAQGLRQPAPSVLDGARHFVVEGVAGAGGKPPVRAPEVIRGEATRASWASFLTAAQIAELHRRARCVESAEDYPTGLLGAIVDLSLQYERAQALAALAIYRCAPKGLRSRDWLLTQAARAHGLVPTPLETPEEVAAQRGAVPDPIYVALLYDAFRPDGDAALQRVVAALNAGDFEAVAETVRATFRSPEQGQIYYDIMVAQRNRTWLPRLVSLLDEGRAVVAVGAYHLAGPQGLVALLEARGYRIAPLKIPAAP